MNATRPISERQKAVIAALLRGKPSLLRFIDSLDKLGVSEMSDGRMGSLMLFPRDMENTSRSFGQQLVLGEFTDSDAVPVSIALNADSSGNLYELDLWKVDFSPLLKWPDPADIRIVG